MSGCNSNYGPSESKTKSRCHAQMPHCFSFFILILITYCLITYCLSFPSPPPWGVLCKSAIQLWFLQNLQTSFTSATHGTVSSAASLSLRGKPTSNGQGGRAPMTPGPHRLQAVARVKGDGVCESVVSVLKQTGAIFGGKLKLNTARCSEIGSLTSLHSCKSGASSDVREPISLHHAVEEHSWIQYCNFTSFRWVKIWVASDHGAFGFV